MKNKVIPLLMVLGISMFCGIIVISFGIGSVVTPLNQVAGPMICRNQQLKIEQNTYSYRPGQRTVTITAYCVDNQTGVKRDVTNRLQVISGIFYGLILFVLAMIGLNWAARRLNMPWEELFKPSLSR